MKINLLTEKIIGCCIEVHKCLGPGLLESTYEECSSYEMTKSGLFVERQKELSVIYKGVKLDCGYRIDLLVETQVILEFKSVEKILPIHEAQIITYLKLSGNSVGLLINFNSIILTKGIKRFVNNYKE